ncbi:MAG: glycosyltransferase [Planctomycetota bacterium]|nr:glycosyltransferase [Planctomycetota bacterium]
MRDPDQLGGSPWVVVATQTPWDEIPRLRHQVTRALARDHRVLYITFPTSWRVKYLASRIQAEPNITVWRPSNLPALPARVIATFPLARRLEAMLLRRSLLGQLTRLSSPPIGMVNFDHRHLWLHDHQLFPRSVYVCNDDHSIFAPTPFLVRWCLQQMRAAARAADGCLAVSAHIAERLEVGAKTQVFVPGHDLRLCEAPSLRTRTQGERIRLGFMGSIDHRLQLAWLQQAAAEPDLEVHLIGPIANQQVRTQLQSIPALHVHAPLTGEALLRWLLEMDVLTMPYTLEIAWSETAAVPNKLPSYFASGRPVVVSDLPNLADWVRSNAYIARNSTEFMEQIRRAVCEDDIHKTMSRISIAKEFTWAKQIEPLLRLLSPPTP